jgi:hypothetical protein
MNPFASIARMIRSPGFRKATPLAGAVGVGAVGPDVLGDIKSGYDENIRDETARELLGGIMDAQEQDARAQAEQEALYMQGVQDAAGMMGGYGGADGGYGELLGSPEGMYSLAAAQLVGPKPPTLKVPPAPSIKSVAGPGEIKIGGIVHKAAISEVPYVLAEAIGLGKTANTAAIIGAGIGGGLGAAQGRGTERFRNALLGAVLGGSGGHVLSNPATMASLKGLGSTVVK